MFLQWAWQSDFVDFPWDPSYVIIFSPLQI